MARQQSSSRTTPKGTRSSKPGSSAGTRRKGGAAARPDPGSHRLTPRKPDSKRGPSPLWVPVAMFTFLAAGVAVIILNYLGALPGGEAQNSDLLVGLGLLVCGFVMSTQYR